MTHSTLPPRAPGRPIELDEFVPSDDFGRPVDPGPAPHIPDVLGTPRLAERPYSGRAESLIVLTVLIVLGAYLIGAFLNNWMPAIRAAR
jgi:hypothetical protein